MRQKCRIVVFTCCACNRWLRDPQQLPGGNSDPSARVVHNTTSHRSARSIHRVETICRQEFSQENPEKSRQREPLPAIEESRNGSSGSAKMAHFLTAADIQILNVAHHSSPQEERSETETDYLACSGGAPSDSQFTR